MTDTAIQQGFTQESFDTFLSTRNEPDWLTQLRQEAWKTYLELDLPSRNQEDWRRTDIRGLKLDRFNFPSQSTAVELPSPLLSHGVELGGQVASIDSVSTEHFLDDDLQKQGVLFGPLDQFAASHEELLKPHFQSLVGANVDKFSALHSAAWSGGALLYVPAGVKVNTPLHMWSGLTPGGSDFSHTLVILEEGASATLMSETVGEGKDPGLHCGTIELIVKPKAKLRYVNLQNWGSGVWHFAHQKATVDREAELQWTIGALGARLAKVNQQVALVGEKSRAQVNGVMFTEGKQHLAYYTLQHHEVPNAVSDLLYKGALQDHSRLVWRGMIKVDPEAFKTDGYQRNDNLMLSSDARVDSIPGLEIEADDVICTHGATAGQVDEDPIYYAQTRGFTRKEAIRMIVAGFFQQVFDRITIESVRESLAEAIGKRVQEYSN